ncbi:FAD-binding dehydrogenase (plasmid) [Sagittula sp. P11]|uniref:FAD-dependent oxidoreductase n=1 Tax=Sagittula sp. P11 TaxID=2009329 RepID=UPI000C2CEC13|nr:FAD-dependent oxidoreductase [Sagittula sp. P11]AUC56200.1 FAD-binding dehydrogenase [Sagittula sp. P11]
MDEAEEFDLVVIGAGAAGLAASATAALAGLRVVVLEATDRVGGTCAISAGCAWLPNTMLSREDDPNAARRYLDHVVGNESRAEMREAFLARAPEMVAELQNAGAIDLAPFAHHPDYHTDLPGAVTRGRALGAQPFDGRKLGSAFGLVKPPLPEFTIMGGMMVDRTDIGHLLRATRSLASFRHAAGLMLRHGRDRLTGPRGRRLVMGNALVGRLLAFLIDRGVEIRTGCRVDRIVVSDGRATGVAIGKQQIAAHCGIVVCTGGFSHHARLRQDLFPDPLAEQSVVPDTNTGGGLDLLLGAGGQLERGYSTAAFWAPASVRTRSDGSKAVFPHLLLDRAKPGIIAVDASGRRFVDESTSYHRFVQGMYRAGAIPCHLVCNAAFIRQYGLGVIHPMTRRLGPWVAEGYLAEGRDIKAIATAIGADPAVLADSFARNDRYAAEGRDPEFNRGSTAYSRNLGDPDHIGPNPCLGPMGEGPYYAVCLHPADIGTAMGIVTDTQARVLDAAGAPIPGLYAAGADMASVMGGSYPGPGITIGPALTFGHVAARHAATSKET